MEIFINHEGDCYRIDSYNYRHGRPAKIFGPPENCYPEEPAEIEDVSVSIETKKGWVKLTDEQIDKLLDDDSFYESLIREADEADEAEFNNERE
jgi:hypothetical protein